MASNAGKEKKEYKVSFDIEEYEGKKRLVIKDMAFQVDKEKETQPNFKSYNTAMWEKEGTKVDNKSGNTVPWRGYSITLKVDLEELVEYLKTSM